MDFKEKVIIVSGSSSGIGKGCAGLLLESNASVVGLDVHQASIENERYSHYELDIRDEGKVVNVLDEIEMKYGKIDGLVNCAGIHASGKPFFDLDLNDWNNVISTNLTGMFVLSKNTAKRMIKNKTGRIVNISCIRSRIFKPGMSDYSAAKGGVVALTSAMALDLKNYNIRVNSVAPGLTYTGITAEAFNDPEIRNMNESMIPVGRIAKPEDIAKVVLFLLSDMSDYINGETIFADGGYKISK